MTKPDTDRANATWRDRNEQESTIIHSRMLSDGGYQLGIGM